MDLAFLNILKDKYMKEIMFKVRGKDKEKSPGLMVQYMKVNFIKEKSMDKERLP